MVKCGECGKEVDALTALESTPYSWPNLQAIWYLCVICGGGNHIRFMDHTVQRVEITGAPGPTWEIIESQQHTDMEVKVESGKLVIWMDGHQFVIRARS